MRNLQTRDVFSMVRLITVLDLRGSLKEIIGKMDENQDAKEVGVDIIFSLFSKCTTEKSEKEVYAFLAGPLEIKPEEVASMDLFDIAEKISEIADIGKWKNFLLKAFRLIK